MSWLPGILSTQALWLFLLFPPLIVLYFLKLKRPRVEIPSLVLWQQVLDDYRVNSPFQRFKRNLLLLMQLLLLLLLILAALQPYWRGGQDFAQRLPLLIDQSASMGAVDTAGGRTRLAQAKRRIEEIIDDMPSNQEICLIAFGRSARRLTDFTGNKRVLLDALENVSVQDEPSNMEEALRMTQALSARQPFDRVILLSDGNFPAKANFSLPFALDFQRFDTGGDNLGITQFNALRGKPGVWEVFAQIQGSSSATMSASVEIAANGIVDERQTQQVAVRRDYAQRLKFQIPTTEAISLRLQIKPDGFDSMTADNTAWLDLEPPRSAWVYCPPTLVAQRLGFEAMDDVKLYPAADDAGDTVAQFDLVVSDQLDDVSLDAGVACYVGVLPDDLKELVTIESTPTIVIDWLRTDPLFENVNLAAVEMLDSPTNAQDVTDADYERRGYEIIAYGEHGPLILRRRNGPRLEYFLLFHTDRSTLPYQFAFPIMMINLATQARHEAGLLETQGNRTGVLPPLHVSPSTAYIITSPDGRERAESSDELGRLTGVPAPRVGVYEIEGPSGGRDVGVGLLDGGETALASVEQIQFRESAVDAALVASVDRSFWRELAIMALVMLMLEWWWYQRRPGGLPR